MKYALSFGLMILTTFSASAAPVWPEAVSLIRRCASQTICVRRDGSRAAQALKSVCPDLVVEGKQARFTFRGKAYLATIRESAESDGGDLNDLVIQDSCGKVLEHYESVLGFNDVLLTLLGGNAQTVQTAYEKCSEH